MNVSDLQSEPPLSQYIQHAQVELTAFGDITISNNGVAASKRVLAQTIVEVAQRSFHAPERGQHLERLYNELTTLNGRINAVWKDANIIQKIIFVVSAVLFGDETSTLLMVERFMQVYIKAEQAMRDDQGPFCESLYQTALLVPQERLAVEDTLDSSACDQVKIRWARDHFREMNWIRLRDALEMLERRAV